MKWNNLSYKKNQENENTNYSILRKNKIQQNENTEI